MELRVVVAVGVAEEQAAAAMVNSVVAVRAEAVVETVKGKAELALRAMVMAAGVAEVLATTTEEATSGSKGWMDEAVAVARAVALAVARAAARAAAWVVVAMGMVEVAGGEVEMAMVMEEVAMEGAAIAVVEEVEGVEEVEEVVATRAEEVEAARQGVVMAAWAATVARRCT